MRAKYLTIFLLLGCQLLSAQQIGSIQGIAYDLELEETLPFWEIELLLGDSTLVKTETDFDGNYNFSNISEGNYTLILRATYGEFPSLQVVGIPVQVGKITKADMKYPVHSDLIHKDGTIRLGFVESEPDKTTGGQTLAPEHIKNMKTRSIKSLNRRQARRKRQLLKKNR